MNQIFGEGGRVYPATLIDLDESLPEDVVVSVPVIITGTSKGKGFTGVMKRHGFHGGPATHGQSDRARAPGSIGGTTTPGRVFRGKKMAGRSGHQRVTVKGLQVLEIAADRRQIAVSGAVPGARGSKLTLQFLTTDGG